MDGNNTERKHLKLNSDYLHCIKKFVNVADGPYAGNGQLHRDAKSGE